MHFLGLDASTECGSVVIFDENRILAKRHVQGHAQHSTSLLRQVDECLQEVGIGPKDLDAIAVGVGPGSFTGIRVALSIAKTFSQVHDVPLISLPSLLIPVFAHWEGLFERSLPVISTSKGFRGELYYFHVAQMPSSQIELSANDLMVWLGRSTAGSPSNLAKTFRLNPYDLAFDSQDSKRILFMGSGYFQYEEEFEQWGELIEVFDPPEPGYWMPAEGIATLARRLWNDRLSVYSANELLPYYVRPSEAERKLNEGIIQPAPQSNNITDFPRNPKD